MSHNQASRREFLRKATILTSSVGTAAAPFALNMAALGSAVAQSSDYKAIVCLFLYGGNDSANMVLPTDATSWATYNTVRVQLPDPIALKAVGVAPNNGAPAGTPDALGGVLPIVPNYTVFAQNNTRTFALHPAMTEAAGLFTAGRLAIIANAGPLINPLTKAEYRARSRAAPPKLFSHNDQQSSWQALGPEGAKIGWGGRLGDLVAGGNSRAVFTNISTSGNAVFLSGETTFQYQVGGGGAVQLGGLTGNLFNSAAAATNFGSIITADNQHLFAKEYAAVVKRSVEAQATFQSAYNMTVVPAPSQVVLPSSRQAANNNLAQQFQTVARTIAARGALGTTRQIFHIGIGGFDTHDGQNRNHADLMARISHALAYFDAQLNTLGLRDAVTVMTASDFGRTYSSNGDGTDHGWGAHHFVMGGAVRGKEIYGRFP
ncbi:MAG: DUF1501 domain-containing protein, partial [Pseudomonadota bacterium]